MKKTLIWIALACAATTYAAAPQLATELKPQAGEQPKSQSAKSPAVLQALPQQMQAANMTAQFLTRFHYKTLPLDDAMSEKIFDRYLKSLDPDKLFFTQADINQFNFARTKLDDAIYNQDLSTPFALFNLYERRVVERLHYARELLKGEFNFSDEDNYYYQRDKQPWPKSEAEIQQLWKQRVKNDWLRLKLAGKDDKAIRSTLEKRYEYTLSRMQKHKSDDVFQLFMNAYAMSIEPHTNYLGPKASEEFDISMRLSMVGIGAVLQERDEYTTIREITPGGPASRSGKLNIGDRIVGVGQGAKSTPTDVVGWRLDDVVALIRGTKDSVVLLDILPADASADAKHKTITLVRDKITLDQQSAKKSIIEVNYNPLLTASNGAGSSAGNEAKQETSTEPASVTANAATGTSGAEQNFKKHKIGVISLPAFYQDFAARQKGDKDFKSATRDIAKLLAELKAEKVESVLIDLRNNGGGSLSEAVELTGLFIGKGPVVQQRNSQGNVVVESDKSASVAWDGPMGVMINRGSASASEIFAAAMQDYGRGLIIGEPSFGKGTVQTVVNLDQVARSEQPKYGNLKMTVAQFFRVNGGTTQLRGVTPDISFPSFADPEFSGESSYDNALPWVQIKPADFHILGDLKDLLPQLQVRHEMRVDKDKEFQFLAEDVREYNDLRQKKAISLNETVRRKERETQEAKTSAREKWRTQEKLASGGKPDAEKLPTQDDGLQANERSLSVEIAAEKARKAAKDVLLTEAANILGDELDLLKSNHKLAERVSLGMSRKIAPVAQ